MGKKAKWGWIGPERKIKDEWNIFRYRNVKPRETITPCKLCRTCVKFKRKCNGADISQPMIVCTVNPKFEEK